MGQVKFYTFPQNNSRGFFDIDKEKGIGHYVIVQAKNNRDANNIAIKKVGIYFDGCESNIDCNCCGDRWNEVFGDGDDLPMIYNESVYDVNLGYTVEPECAFIHYLDGTIEQVNLDKKY